jgi:Tfp pilus assembly protein PilF
LFNNIGLCHMKLGEPTEAGYYLERCLELEPSNEKA